MSSHFILTLTVTLSLPFILIQFVYLFIIRPKWRLVRIETRANFETTTNWRARSEWESTRLERLTQTTKASRFVVLREFTWTRARYNKQIVPARITRSCTFQNAHAFAKHRNAKTFFSPLHSLHFKVLRFDSIRVEIPRNVLNTCSPEDSEGNRIVLLVILSFAVNLQK